MYILYLLTCKSICTSSNCSFAQTLVCLLLLPTRWSNTRVHLPLLSIRLDRFARFYMLSSHRCTTFSCALVVPNHLTLRPLDPLACPRVCAPLLPDCLHKALVDGYSSDYMLIDCAWVVAYTSTSHGLIAYT